MIGIVSFFLLAGCLIVFIAALGLVRFTNFYRRIHASSLVSSVGMICIMTASVLFFYSAGDGFAGRALLVILFLLFTVPMSMHMIGKSYYYRDLKSQRDNIKPL